MNKAARNLILTITSFLFGLPLVSAQEIIGTEMLQDSMQAVVEMIAAIFAIDIQSTDTYVGLVKFLLFIIAFAASHRGLRKTFDNKASGAIAFAVALGAVIFIPNEWAIAYGGVFGGLLLFGYVGFSSWYAMMKLNDDWVKHLFGFLILLFNLVIISFFYENLNGIELGNEVLSIILSSLYFVTVILLVVKIVMIITGMFSGGKKWDSPWGRSDRRKRRGGEDTEEVEETEPSPTTGRLRIEAINDITGRPIERFIIYKVKRRTIRKDKVVRLMPSEWRGKAAILNLEEGEHELFFWATGFTETEPETVRISAGEQTSNQVRLIPDLEVRSRADEESNGVGLTFDVRLRDNG